MRLECANEPPGLRLLGRLECRRDFCRMMRIVVHHPDAFFPAFGLEAPLRPMERSQPFCHLLHRQPDADACHDSCHGIEHVMPPRDIERHMAKILSLMHHIEGNARAVRLDIRRMVIRRFLDGIGNVLPVHLLGNIAQVFIFKAEHRIARLFVHIFDELSECRADIVHRPIVVHVVVFHIRHHCDMRMQFQK